MEEHKKRAETRRKKAVAQLMSCNEMEKVKPRQSAVDAFKRPAYGAEPKPITENEAIKRINECRNTPNFQPYNYVNEALNMAIQALEEIQQYRAIGTIEECREAVEKQNAKFGWEKIEHGVNCPHCGNGLTKDMFPTLMGKPLFGYCPFCGHQILEEWRWE